MVSKTLTLKSNEFKNVFQKGKFYSNANIAAKILKNNLDYNRFGVSIGKKYSTKAVIRNKIKRQIKNALEELQKENEMPLGFDIVIFIHKAPENSLDYQSIKKQIFSIYKKSNLL